MSLRRSFGTYKILGTFGVTLLTGIILLAQLISLTGAAEAPLYGGTFVIGIRSEPETFNLGISSAGTVHYVGGQIYDTLVVFDFNYVPQPELAESWEISDGGLTYKFNLVKNVTWHDGEPFTSEDVKWNIEELYYNYHPVGKAAYDCVDTIETPDPYTVILKLKYLFPALMKYLSGWNLMLMPKHIYEGTDILTNPHNLDNPIGCGPFMFEEYVQGSHITFVRNPNYWKKGKPYLDKIIFRIIPDPTTLAAAFEKGEIDYMATIDVPLERVADWEKMEYAGIQIVHSPPLPKAYHNIDHIFLNFRRPPLDNVLVRRALTHAIDKDAIVERTTFGIHKVAWGPIPSAMAEYYNPDVQKYEYDPQKAEALLDQAGVPRGPDGIRFKTSLLYNFGRSGYEKAAEMIREYWGAVGVDLELKPADSATCSEYTRTRYDFDCSRPYGFVCSPEPSVQVARIYDSGFIKPGLWNVFPYNNSQVDALWEQSLQEVDDEARAALYKEVQALIVEDCPAIWLFEYAHVHAYRDKWVEGSGRFGVTIPSDLHFYGGYDSLQWKGGEEVSLESARSEIETTEAHIENLKRQFYDVSESLVLIDQAKNALEAGEWATASSLAKRAIEVAIPPYWLYALIAGVVIIVPVAGIYWYKRRKRRT